MCHCRLELEQVFGVLWVVDRTIDIVAGEGADRFERFPERDEQKLRLPIGDSSQDTHAAIAGGGASMLQAGRLQIFEILIGLSGFGAAAPDSRDHRLIPPLPQPTNGCKLL